MSRLRVLQIIPGIAIGDQSGGAELYAVQISRLLSKEEFDPAVFVMTRFGSLSEDDWRSKLIAEGITVGGFIRPDSSLISSYVMFSATCGNSQRDFVPMSLTVTQNGVTSSII